MSKVLRVAKDLFDIFYPIGSYYETSNLTWTPQGAGWYGTWVEDSAGTTTVARDDGTFQEIGTVVGAETVKLTKNQSGLPKHGHGLKKNVPYGLPYNNTSGSRAGDQGAGPYYGENYNPFTILDNDGFDAKEAHNNIQPSTIVRRWHRTA